MPAERYYSEPLSSKDSEIALEGQELHHLLHVMRNQVGDHVEIINGKGILAKAVVDKIDKRRALLKIIELHVSQPDPFSLILAQGIPRANRLDFILEKGTELGMNELWLFPGTHSEKKTLSEQRLKALLIAAMKQCGRVFIPTLKIMPPLNKWEKPKFPCFFGDTNPSAKSFEAAWKAHQPKNGAVVCIGPESGFNEEEVKKLESLEAIGVTLHENILRTDTAALAALTMAWHYKTAPL